MARLLIYLKPYIKKVSIKVKTPHKISNKTFEYYVYVIKLGYKFYLVSIKPFKLFLLGEIEVSPPW